MKKVLALALALVMVFAMVQFAPAASAAQDERLHDMIDREDAVYTPPKQ